MRYTVSKTSKKEYVLEWLLKKEFLPVQPIHTGPVPTLLMNIGSYFRR